MSVTQPIVERDELSFWTIGLYYRDSASDPPSNDDASDDSAADETPPADTGAP